MRFRTTVELGGKTATGLRVPKAVVEAVGQGKKRLPVVVTIGGHSYRSTVAPYSGAYYLPLSAENREAAGVRAGDEIEVEITLDDAPREVTVPADLAAAIAGDAAASSFFEGLSYSNKRRFVMGVEEAKSGATRERRIGKVVTMLREGRTEG